MANDLRYKITADASDFKQGTLEAAKSADKLKESVDKTNTSIGESIKKANEYKREAKLIELQNAKLAGSGAKVRNSLASIFTSVKMGDARGLTANLQSLSQGVSSLRGNFGAVAQSSGGARAALTAFGGAATVATAALAAVGIAVQQYISYNEKLTEQNKIIKAYTNQSGDELSEFRDKVDAIAKQYGQDINEITRASNSLAKNMGISYNEAAEIISKGLAVNGANGGEFLEQIREYAPYFKEAGIEADQFAAIVSKGFSEGIFNDKAPDTIKEANIRLREMTKATADAINGIGLSSTAIQKGLKDGSITTSDAIKQISQRISELPPSSQAVGTALADIFGSAGEDSSLRFVTSLKDIEGGMDELVENNPLAQIDEENRKATEDMGLAWDSMFDSTGKGFSEWWGGVKVSFIKGTTKMLDGFRAFINGCIKAWYGFKIAAMATATAVMNAFTWVGAAIEYVADLLKTAGKNSDKIWGEAARKTAQRWKGTEDYREEQKQLYRDKKIGRLTSNGKSTTPTVSSGNGTRNLPKTATAEELKAAKKAAEEAKKNAEKLKELREKLDKEVSDNSVKLIKDEYTRKQAEIQNTYTQELQEIAKNKEKAAKLNKGTLSSEDAARFTKLEKQAEEKLYKDLDDLDKEYNDKRKARIDEFNEATKQHTEASNPKGTSSFAQATYTPDNSLEGQLDGIQKLMDANDAYIDKLEELKKKLEELGLTGTSEYSNITKAIADTVAENDKLGSKASSTNGQIQQGKKVSKKWQDATDSLSSFGDMLSSISELSGDDVGLNVAGIIAQAVAQIALGAATASAQASSMGPWGWIAFSIAAMAQMVGMIAQIHSATGYADGGIIQSNSYVGDKGLVRVNGGEMILNGREQANLFRLLDSGTKNAGGSVGGGNVEFKIRGNELYGVLKNYNKTKSALGKDIGIK